MNDHLHDALEEFVDARVNFLGKHEPGKLQDLHRESDELGKRLRENTTAEQLKLLRDCEALHGETDAETMRFYYKGGFYDAIQFMMVWYQQK